MAAEASTREELLATYERPYARWLPRLYDLNRVGPACAGAGALVVVTALVAVLHDGGAPGALVALAGLAVVLAVAWTLWVTAAGARVIRARTAEWRREDRSELARVRTRRPHAAEADREVAHVEYGVSVEDDGRLVTWAFEPLEALEDPGPAARVLVGTPRYAVREVAEAPYDARDAVLAAEQLAAAQEDAAAREQAAIDRTRAALDARERRRELEAEVRSTGAALRRVTGQSADDERRRR